MLVIDLPIEYHITILALLLVIRAGIAIYKVLPALRGFYRSLSRISSKIDVLSNRLEQSNSGDSPFKNGGQKRGISTLGRDTKKINIRTPLPKKEGGVLKTIARAQKTVKSNSALLLSSRRIKGLFASIVENGSLVSLATSWVLEHRNVELDQKEVILKDLSKGGTITKVKANPNGTFNIWSQKHGSVADLITAFGWRIVSLAFPNKVKFAGRLRLLSLFSQYIWRIYRTNGSEQVVKFLKAGQLAIQKSIAHDHVGNLRELDKDVIRSRLTAKGLPVIIPSRDRRLINGGAEPVIRFWLTLFSLYRVISIPGTLKLSTIISPLDVNKDRYHEVVQTFDEFLSLSKIQTMFDLRILQRPGDILLLEAASASHKVAWTGLFTDPALLGSLGSAVYARKILGLLGQEQLLLFFDGLLDFGRNLEFQSPHLNRPRYTGISTGDGPFSHSVIGDPEGCYSGKLSIKEEAAGKLRVFAMADI
jgi:hypothetical protein